MEEDEEEDREEEEEEGEEEGEEEEEEDSGNLERRSGIVMTESSRVSWRNTGAPPGSVKQRLTTMTSQCFPYVHVIP